MLFMSKETSPSWLKTWLVPGMGSGVPGIGSGVPGLGSGVPGMGSGLYQSSFRLVLKEI